MEALPAALLRAHPPVIRPKDAEWWRNPAKELRRLARQGLIAHVGHGLYVVPPANRVGDRQWRAEPEALALALAQREQGIDATALMAISAARLHGAWPRPVQLAVVAVPRQRRPIASEWAEIRFVTRSISSLDLTRVETELTEGWCTSPEQTLLDAADRPELVLGPRAASDVIVALTPRVEWDLVAALARRQRKHAAYARARWVAEPVIAATAPPPSPPSGRLVPSLGMRPPAPVAEDEFGIAAEG